MKENNAAILRPGEKIHVMHLRRFEKNVRLAKWNNVRLHALHNVEYLGQVLLGSTVERLLREIPCATLVVRPPTGDGSNLLRVEKL